MVNTMVIISMVNIIINMISIITWLSLAPVSPAVPVVTT